MLADTGSYNPLHDTALDEVEFPSGLTEKMFAQIDSKWHHQQILKEISEYL